MKKAKSSALLSMVMLLLIGPDTAVSTDNIQQELTHRVTVVNIEVPVRVFKGGQFMDNLSLDDFEVFEDGRPQKIEAVYLIRNRRIEKQDGLKKFSPDIKNRHFILIFEMDDYLPEIDKVWEYFIMNVLTPEDTVAMVTPRNTYHLNKGELNRTSRETIVDRFKVRLRKDLRQEGIDLRNLTHALSMVAEHASKLPQASRLPFMRMAKSYLKQIRERKRLDESGLGKLADALKKLDGQKHVFLVYQKEALPVPTIFGILLDDFDLGERRDFDQENIGRLFADASIVVHFLFVTEIKTKDFDASGKNPGAFVLVRQGSDEIYGAFKDMASTTGGLTESSANPSFSFQKAVEASENYYLLYYKPSEYKQDGWFKEIEVEVKSGDCQIYHRAGYIDR